MSRLVVFASDLPYPPNRGGRADVWRRLQGLQRLGHALMLVSWHAPHLPPTAEQQRALRMVASELIFFPTRGGPTEVLSRLLLLPRLPSHVAARRLQPAQRNQVYEAMRTFGAQAAWAEGSYPADEARRAALTLGVPWVYRSHNIEHLYMERQTRAAARLRDRLAWRAACIGLQRFERRAIDDAAWVYDISIDDMAWWRAQGVTHISWLPPLAESALVTASDATAPLPPADVAFLGNLTTPNNVRGVEWLVREIVPLLRRAQPNLRVRVAGSNPGPAVHSWCAAAGVELLANPPDALAVYRSARVLVNPVRTGSGTHMKAVEMLFTDAPIVSATQGTQGLPEDVKRLFRVADDAPRFAAAVLQALTDGPESPGARSDARQQFGLNGLTYALVRHGLGQTDPASTGQVRETV